MKIFKFQKDSPYAYILRQDGCLESLFDKRIEENIRVEFLEEASYSDLTQVEKEHYDFLMNSGADTLYVKTVSELNLNINSKNSGKMKLSKMFGNIQIGKLRGDQFAVAMDMSIAIKGKDGKLYTVGADGGLVDQMSLAFPMKDAFFGLPVAYNAVKSGDVIIDGKGRALFVKEVNSAGKLKCVNPDTGGETTVVKISNIAFGTQFVTKVTSLMSMMGAQPGQTPEQISQNNSQSPFGQINPMMFMLMGDGDDSEKNLLPLIMMANQGQNGQTPFNPMMMMMMMKDDSEGGFGGDFAEMMMYSQMFGGGNTQNANPFGNIFGQPVVPQPETTQETTSSSTNGEGSEE